MVNLAVRHAVHVCDEGGWGRVHVAEKRLKKRLQDLAMRPGRCQPELLVVNCVLAQLNFR